jgi:glycosyltransferase involved in cell wall biosynthesis
MGDGKDIFVVDVHSLVFDAQWYLAEYPDVRLSGMDPLDHYQWLGRRLNRLPCAREGSLAQPDPVLMLDPYREEAVVEAFDKLCRWIAPDRQGVGGLTAQDIFDAMRWDFGHGTLDGAIQYNPNARKLVDFMRSFEPRPDLAARFDLMDEAVEAKASPAILLASFYAPTMAHAGGLRILDTYAQIRKRRPNARLTLFAPLHEEVDGNLAILDDIFDEIHFCRPEQFRADWLMGRLSPGQRFDLADLQFHQAGTMAPELRALARRLIFTPMETLSRFTFDEVREAAAQGTLDRGRLFATIHHGAMEREIIANVDVTVCVSDADAGFLNHISGEDKVNYYPTGLSTIEFARELAPDYAPPAFDEKYNRLVFAAYFGSETNRLGLQWYLEQVHPLVLAAVPDYDLAVVGRGDASLLEALETPAVHFIGEVPNLAPVLEQAKAGLVLALNGSGFRGKINQYALCGLPTISTPLGATGLTYEHGRDILIADGAQAFAQACIDLLQDSSFGANLALAARDRALSHYSWDGIWPRMAAIYGLGGQA